MLAPLVLAAMSAQVADALISRAEIKIAVANNTWEVPAGYEWGLFRESVLDQDRDRIVTKYKNAGNWITGVGLGPMPNITVADTPDDLGFLRDDHGAQPLTNYNRDSFYYGAVSIGTPGQVLNVDIDTGSADLWVQSGCTSSGCSSSQFRPTKSKSFKGTGKPFHVQYGSGSVTGSLVHDTVTIAGLTVKDQYFGAVNKPSEDFKGTPSSGLIGMAFSSIATSRKPTWFENIIMTSPKTSPLFSVFLTRGTARGSEACFGCYDKTKARSPITWLPVVSKTYWAVAMTGAIVNKNIVPVHRNIFAAIDTGTTLIYVPDALAKSIYSQVPGAKHMSAGYYTAPCDTFSRLSVALVFNGSPFNINMVDFNLGRIAPGSSTCVAGLLGLGNSFPDNLAIIGDEFLKSWYSTYDYSKGSRVGFSRSIL
ncbi:acid protease [Exidia glandulosa HHB12029]|uniref:Acid protease n=1 Tax=Exidia glandulosa HHB12029 TaxID=1314781 RepID=A0A165I046_EXIGL|nr:acid protease [Exidia glandulosa HHB12029]